MLDQLFDAVFGHSIGYRFFVELVPGVSRQHTCTFGIDHEDVAWDPAGLDIRFDGVIRQ